MLTCETKTAAIAPPSMVDALPLKVHCRTVKLANKSKFGAKPSADIASLVFPENVKPEITTVDGVPKPTNLSNAKSPCANEFLVIVIG
jgi:hypothetical protein